MASGGTVTVTDGVVPPSDAVTLDPGVYAWNASYSGDTLNAPSKSVRESGIEIVLPPESNCPTGAGWLSVRCFRTRITTNNGNGDDNHGGNKSATVAATTTSGGNNRAMVAVMTTTAERSAAERQPRAERFGNGGG